MKRYFRLFGLVLSISSVATHLCAEVGNDNPTGVTGEHNGSVTTAGSYDPYTGNSKRFIDDLTVTGAVGAYPLKWTRVLNTRGVSGAFGDGGGWSHSYAWGMWIRGANPPHGGENQYEGPDGGLSYPDGRVIYLQSQDGVEYSPLTDTKEPMDRLVNVGNGFDLVLRDGGKVEFRHPQDSTRATDLVAVAIVDPYLQRTTLQYDSQNQTLKITEPAGRFLLINFQRLYGLTSDSYIDVIASVQAFAGPNNLVETVTYGYDPEYAQGMVNVKFWNLTQVHYDDNTTASYTYYPAGDATNNKWSMCPGRVESCRDVRFAGSMKNIKYEYMNRSQSDTWGQISAEKNVTTNPSFEIALSRIEYPAYQSAQITWRTEHRADGKTRTFHYDTAELSDYTDFQNHISYITYAGAGDGINYLKFLKDARGNTTTLKKNNETGALISVTHPQNAAGETASIFYDYSNHQFPYYLISKTDELNHTIVYDRDTKNRIWKVHYPDDGVEQFTYDESTNNFGQVRENLMTSGGTEE